MCQLFRFVSLSEGVEMNLVLTSGGGSPHISSDFGAHVAGQSRPWELYHSKFYCAMDKGECLCWFIRSFHYIQSHVPVHGEQYELLINPRSSTSTKQYTRGKLDFVSHQTPD